MEALLRRLDGIPLMAVVVATLLTKPMIKSAAHRGFIKLGTPKAIAHQVINADAATLGSRAKKWQILSMRRLPFAPAVLIPRALSRSRPLAGLAIPTA